MCNSPRLPGIYAIRCLVDGKNTTYVGQAIRTIRRRFSDHRKQLRKGVHRNNHLQRAWNKYGEHAFAFIVLENLEPDPMLLVQREQFWLDQFRRQCPTYNRANVTRSPRLGTRQSPAARAKISKAMKGRILTDEWRKKIALAQTGRKLSPEHVAHMKTSRKGKTMPSDHRQKIAQALRGHKMKEATKQKLREIMTGRKASAETRAKISLASKARQYPTRAKAYPALANIFTMATVPAGEKRSEFAKKHNIATGNFAKMIRGQLTHTDGWMPIDRYQSLDLPTRERLRTSVYATYNRRRRKAESTYLA